MGRDARMDRTAIEERVTPLEEGVAHLLRAVDDLSDTVARQERELATLSRRVRLLLEREAEREAQALRDAPATPPPHW